MYFKTLPNLLYSSRLPGSSRSSEKIEVKNFFRRAALREDLLDGLIFADFYEIEDGERPEMVAEKFYEDPELDWLVLTINNSINIKDQWPLDNNQLHRYMLEKYSSEEGIVGIHHYETREIRDEFDRIVLRKGMIVDSDFTITYTSGLTEVTKSAAGPVSNYDYEIRKNNAKRIIQIPKPEYVAMLTSELKEMMKYERSSQYITSRLKDTYNPREFGV